MRNQSIPRRVLLKNGGVALAAFGTSQWLGPAFLRRAALAADGAGNVKRSRKVLICVFQRGAADGLSMVVPHGDPFYYRHREAIAIASPSRNADADAAALDLDGFFGLHPLMASLLPLYKAGHLAPIHACGSPSGSRSHFDMQDYMESGVADDKRTATGWLARLGEARAAAGAARAGRSSPFRAVAMTASVPRSLQGDAEALAIPDLTTFGVNGATPATPGARGGGGGGGASGFEGMYEQAVGDVLHGAAKGSFEAIDLLRKAEPAKYKPAKGVEYPAGNFGRSLLQVAQLVKADVGLEIAFVESDGWDTHVNQGAAVGQLAGRLYDFSRGLAALYADLGDRMDDVLLLTMSEFGRAARQNGSRGTDHGHGTCFLAMGGKVNGGKVLGRWPGLAPETLFEDRDLAVTTDYRDVFAEACVRHFGVPERAMAGVFPKFDVDAKRFSGIRG